MAASERTALLRDVSRLADRIIIGDYAVPPGSGWGRVLDEIVEFFAGRDHYTNYKTFIANGGIHGVAARLPLSLLEEPQGTPRRSHLVVLRSDLAGRRQPTSANL